MLASSSSSPAAFLPGGAVFWFLLSAVIGSAFATATTVAHTLWEVVWERYFFGPDADKKSELLGHDTSSYPLLSHPEARGVAA